MLALGANHDQDPNPGFHGCTQIALPLNYLAMLYLR